MPEAIAATGLVLFLGDVFSTFFYHVPEHAFGKFHLKTHHAPKRDFCHYAVLSFDLKTLLDGLLGAIPYLVIAALTWKVSWSGTVVGLIIGQAHVWWRHTSIMGWETPPPVARLCQRFSITTPEKHWLHHQNPTLAFGDIFTCLDHPAQAWLAILLKIKKRYRHASAQARRYLRQQLFWSGSNKPKPD